MYRRPLLLVLGITAALLTTPAAATAGTGCVEAIVGSAPTLHPEGVAYEPIRNRFMVGSITHGTVGIVNPDGSVRPFVDDPTLITTMGLSVDVLRGRVLAVNGDIGRGDRSTPATIRKTAGLGIYSLLTGRRIRYVDLGALDPSRGHFGNDVAVGLDGTAYVTDSISGAVYRVPVWGAPEVLVRDDRLTPVVAGNGANGIVLHPHGFLIVAQSSGRALYRVPLDNPAMIEQVVVNEPIGAPDGLLLDGRDGLLAIDNTRANRVIRLESTDGWRTATVRASLPWPDPAPTTMARSRCGVYVLTGRLDLLQQGIPSNEFRLRRLP
jgi:sugar lactone lactonase YvrE